MPFAFFTMVMAVGLFGYVRTRQPKHLYIFSAAFSLAFATKEATYITGFIWAVFIAVMIALKKFDPDGKRHTTPFARSREEWSHAAC